MSSYGNLRLPSRAPGGLKAFVRDHIDPRFEEFEFLLTLQMPGAGPKGSLQLPYSILLLSLCDASAQFLITDQTLSNRELFEKFLLDFYPWDKDKPLHMTRQEACAKLWTLFRNPLTHLFGIRPDKQEATAIGRSLAPPDIAHLNSGERRPSSEPFIDRNIRKARIVFWIDGFYWGLRRAVEKAFEDDTQWPLIKAHIKGGHFVRKPGRKPPRKTP